MMFRSSSFRSFQSLPSTVKCDTGAHQQV